MSEVFRALPILAKLNQARRLFVGRPTMVLCLLSGVVGFTLLSERNLRVSDAGALSRREPALERWASTHSAGVQVYEHARAVPTQRSEDGLWSEREKSGQKRSTAHVDAGASFYRALSLDETAQRALLSRAPMEFTKAARLSQVIITLPMPDGTFARFQIEESPVMAAELGAHFPDIRTYRARGVDDPTATARLDLTPAGFHAIALSDGQTVIVEPAPHANRDHSQYVSYDLSQKQREALQGAGAFSCVVLGAEQAGIQSKKMARNGDGSSGLAIGATLRTYRLALAATAEFTQTYGGGTVAGSLSAMTTLINGVNAIYERDLGIHLTLVGNETSIIFTNSATDGYTSDEATQLIVQNQSVLDSRIGAANYDIGMVLDGRVYAYQPGRFVIQGAGQPQVVCSNGQKGKGVSIFRSTEPSSIPAIYTLAHEMGHMFGALHTYNGTTLDCAPSRFAQAAYEPGSGTTIMAYRGAFLPNGTYWNLCADEEIFSADTYFHTFSIEQIVNFTTFGNGSFCSSVTNTGNTPPNIDAGADHTIPANTPFTLTAIGSDADADALTYCWEEFDLGAPGPPNTDNGNRPIFRSFAPVANPSRTFPQLSDILSGTQTFGESLPITDRTMNFRVTVRDNHAGGGGVNTGAMSVNVVSSSGPFTVTQPGASATWTVGSTQTVTWNVANTSSAPINSASVRVLLSIDGGNSFPFTLATGVPNTGAATISVPNMPTSSARVKVEAAGNIFFNISPANFTIAANTTSPPTLLTEANTNRAIALDAVTFVRDPFPVATAGNFSLDQRTRIMLFATGLELMLGESISVVTAEAEDSAHKIFPLTVEYVGKITNFDWCTQIIVRLPDGFVASGDALVSVSLRGAASNKVIVGIR